MLRSTFASFVTAQSGLVASQKALDVTGQNMANVNTIGYTRQRLDQVSISAGGYSNRYTNRPSIEIGQGVKITGVSQIRDQFLDVRFRREYAQLGESEAKLDVLQDLSAVFDEIAVTGLNNQIADFITQLQTLSKQTGNPEFDGIVRSSARVLSELFNQYSRQIESVREQQTNQLENIYIPRVNTILETLSTLNQNIREDQTYGNKALELLDQRNLLIDELSQYMKIDVKYTPVELAPGIVVEDIQISMVDDNAVPPASKYIPIVDNENIAKFSTVSNAGGTVDVALTNWASGSVAQPITGRFSTGAIKGILDQLNKSGEFDGPPASDVRGIGFYSKMLDELASKFAAAFNDANGAGIPLFENGDGDITDITAGNITIAEGWAKGQYGITTSLTTLPDDTSGANDNVLYMISLFSTKYDFKDAGNYTIFNGSFQEFFSQTGNILALETRATETISANYATVVNGVDELRAGVSSVSLDEEGINLIKYQQSYNAAARLMTTLDEALDMLINRMGIVGR